MTKVPPYLKKGDTIGLIAPAGFMPADDYQQSTETLRDWGYKLLMGKTPGNQYHYFSGTDDERLNDLQAMLDNPEVKAIFCVRGGYGVGRIIDRIDFKKFKKNPKWIIGFSDITILLNHVYSKFNIATMHAPMSAAFNDGQWENEYVQSLRKALSGKKGKYRSMAHSFNQPGQAEGILVGGNLALFTHLIGTDSDVDMRNKILFLEDIGEYIYSIDRMMTQLRRTGRLEKLKGLVFGSFSEMKDTTVPFGLDVENVLKQIVKDYPFPVAFGFPVGHENENYPLKIGVKYDLTVGPRGALLQEK